MKMQRNGLATLTCLAAIGFFAGCDQQAAPTKPATTSPAATTESDDGHDHGDGEHAAHGAGPHDGTLADWGGGAYHVEFTVDHDKQQATVYILGDDEKTATPIPADEIQLTIIDPQMSVVLQADPQEGDSEGQASRFVGTHEKLGIVQEYAGTISGVIEDTPYAGDFKEVAHGH